MAKTALITGASVGIGYELAKQFARAGHDLILVARNEDKLNEVAAEIRALNVNAHVIVSDLAKPTAPQELFDETTRRDLPVDYLVNNAGFGALGKFHALDLQRQLDMIQVNVAALTALTHLFLQPMLARDAGGVLNVASTASFQAGPLMAIYYATKAFVLSFTEAIGEELKRTNIHVTALCPGPTHSEFRARAKMDDSNVFRSKTIPVMTAEAVARAGYEGLLRNKRVVVPGWMNKLGVQATRIGPRKFVTRMAGKINQSK